MLGWVQSQQKSFFLNEFRWTSEMIAWKKLPSPKNQYIHDICIDPDTPIVATSKSRITYIGKYNATDEIENEMMAVRWRVFDFFYQIPAQNQLQLTPCGKCFSDLVLMAEL